MKASDQLYLERLYEQIVNSSFVLLDEEDEYFDKIARILSNLIAYKQDQLKKYAINFKKLKTLSNFDQMLWAENVPWIFDKDKTDKIEFAVNETYKNMITNGAMERVEVSCKSVTDIPLITFNDNDDNAVEVVKITDKQMIQKALKDLLIRALKKWCDSFKSFKRFEEPNIWYEWRAQQLKIQTLRDKLPEIKGIF